MHLLCNDVDLQSNHMGCGLGNNDVFRSLLIRLNFQLLHHSLKYNIYRRCFLCTACMLVCVKLNVPCTFMAFRNKLYVWNVTLIPKTWTSCILYVHSKLASSQCIEQIFTNRLYCSACMFALRKPTQSLYVLVKHGRIVRNGTEISPASKYFCFNFR